MQMCVVNMLFCLFFIVQRLELQKRNADDPDQMKGQIIISLISRDKGSSAPAITDTPSIQPVILNDPNELPDG